MDEGKEVMTHDRRAILPVHPLEENRIGVTVPKGPDGDGRGAVAYGYRTAAVAAGLVPGGASPIGNGHPLGMCKHSIWRSKCACRGTRTHMPRKARGKGLWNIEQGTFTLGLGSTKPSIRNYWSCANRPAWALPDCCVNSSRRQRSRPRPRRSSGS